MKPVDLQYNSTVQISGYCHEDFQEVAEIFVQILINIMK